MKNKILIAINVIAVLVFAISACLVDSDTWVPFIVCLVCLAYLALFMYANKKNLERWWGEY